MRRRIKVTLAYLGTGFSGWQRQPARRTVQGEVEAALGRVLGEAAPPVVGAGRTDAGVHARGQVAHLHIHPSMPVESLQPALNNALPPEIRIRGARAVSDSFHSRFDARGKHYTYRIHWGPQPLPWAALRSAEVRRAPSEDAVRGALGLLVGRHDVASFTVPEAAQRSTERTLFRVWMAPRRNGFALHFIGDGFLRYQVRRMVGAVLEVGWKQRSLAGLRELLARPQAGSRVWTAPATGLTLERVFYRRGPVVDSVSLG